MRRSRMMVGGSVLAAAAVAGALALRSGGGPLAPRTLLAGYDPARTYPGVDIGYPYDGAVFPPESIPPTFTWSSTADRVDTWLVQIAFASGAPLEALVNRPEWTPDDPTWTTFKARSSMRPARVTVLGVAAESPRVILARGSLTVTTSTDPVGAPLFYREVPLPFIDAVKDPSRIRWRFGTIDSRTTPPIVLDNLPVCGNCHSFSADGRVLGMDVDYANDKGSYVITETAKQIGLEKNKVITWSDFRKEEGHLTFGLLSQVSPDGRYAISTVRDRSVFVAKPDIAFSQLFFPLKGILAFYDRQTGTFEALPGADDPDYVQSNPVWSPDGKSIVFARSRAYELKSIKDPAKALLTPEECEEFLKEGKTFKFDLYRIPFNGGEGGEAVPIRGASGNGQSNYFARYSPDGKWIVFCRANSFMLLQPDSELFIIPAEGGEARRLSCNTSRMNSWHSFSPNGRWLVFSSKVDTPYTQLFLAHMDEQGQSAPPVALPQLTAPDRAANIPEFVNLPADAIARIQEAYVDDSSYVRTAIDNVKARDSKGAAEYFNKALALNPDHAVARAFMGGILGESGEFKKAHEHLDRALELDPENVDAYYYLGNTLAKESRYEQAIAAWKKAIELDPENAHARNNLGGALLGLGRTVEAEQALRAAIAADPKHVDAHANLGNALDKLGRRDEAIREWQETVRLDDNIAEAHVALGNALLEARDFDGAIEHLEAARRLTPHDVSCMMNLGAAYAHKGDLGHAAELTERAASVATKRGRMDVVEECQRRLRSYRRAQAP